MAKVAFSALGRIARRPASQIGQSLQELIKPGEIFHPATSFSQLCVMLHVQMLPFGIVFAEEKRSPAIGLICPHHKNRVGSLTGKKRFS